MWLFKSKRPTLSRLPVLFLMPLVILIFGIIALPASAAPPDPGKAPSGRYKTGEILVRYSATSTQSELSAIFSRQGAQQKRDIPKLRMARLQVPAQLFEATLAALKNTPGIELVEPNYFADTQDTPANDPGFSMQWGLQAIGAPAAWNIQTGSNNVTVALIDTGVDLTHPDLQNKIVAGWNFVSENANPQDDNGHGTHVAGIIAAETNNGTGIAGISWGARIMPLKALDASGSGTYSDIAEAIVYATDHGAKIINLSLGGTAPSVILEDAVNYAYNHGVVVVAAAGNQGSSGVTYPAKYANTIAVSAIDSNLNIASFSSQGSEIDVAAPGVSIYSTFFGGTYKSMSGTSMAAPHVSGVAALLMSTNQFDTPNKVRSAIENTALDLDSQGKDSLFGYGLVKASNALGFNNFQSTPTPIGTSTPTPKASPIPSRTPTLGATQTPTPTPTKLPTPSGQSVILLSDGSNLFVINPTTGSRNDLGNGEIVPPEFLLSTPDKIKSLSEISGSLSLTPGYLFQHALISPDGRQSVFVEGIEPGGEYKVWLVDLTTLDKQLIYTYTPSSSIKALLDPILWSGNIIYFEEYIPVGPYGRLKLWKLDTVSGQFNSLPETIFPPHDLISVASPANDSIALVANFGKGPTVALFNIFRQESISLASLANGSYFLLGWTSSDYLDLIKALPLEKKQKKPITVSVAPFLYWPLPDSRRDVQCWYGPYSNCVTGATGYHYGNDIDVSTNADTPVYAAA